MWGLIVNLAFIFLATLFKEKPKSPPASTIEDFNIPIITEGTELGKAYGTVIIAPQPVWYGDLDTIKIKDSQGKK